MHISFLRDDVAQTLPGVWEAFAAAEEMLLRGGGLDRVVPDARAFD